MTHAIVKLAQNVLENSDSYSECVLTRAQAIIDWSNEKRALVKKLWEEYHRVYQQYVVLTYGVRPQKTTTVTRPLYQKEFQNNSNLTNDFHKCKNALSSVSSMELTFIYFKGSLEASKYHNIQLMHKYLTCVNAKRLDNSVADVGFLRDVPQSELTEIILFRLLKQVK